MRTRLAGAILAVWLTGPACYSMQRVTVADLGSARTNRVWVTNPDQSRVLISDAQVFRGKLVGFVDGKYLELVPEDLHAIDRKSVV